MAAPWSKRWIPGERNTTGSGEALVFDRRGNTDFEAVSEWHYSITPLHLDLTDYASIRDSEEVETLRPPTRIGKTDRATLEPSSLLSADLISRRIRRERDPTSGKARLH